MEHLVRVSHTTRARGMALHALVAMDLPGPGTGFLSQPWRFPAPVGIPSRRKPKCWGLHATKPVTHLKVRVRRQTGEVVLDGEAWCYTVGPEARGALD